MNPLIILAVIGMIIGGIWYGASSLIYNADGTVKIPFLSFIPRFPIDFSQTEIPKPSLNDTNNTLPIDDWISTMPMNEIWENIWDGTHGILQWMSNIMTGVVTWVIRLVSPSTQVPSYMATIVFWLIILLFIFLAWTHLESLIIKIITVLLIIIFIIFSLIIVLLLLNLI